MFGATLAGAFVVESLFDWPGLGSYAVTAIATSDYQAMLAVVLIVGALYALINILVDIVHAWIGPRTKERL